MDQKDVERLHRGSRVHAVYAPELDGAGEKPMITLGGVHTTVYLVLDEDGEPRMRISVDLDEMAPELAADGEALPMELMIAGQRVWWARWETPL
jgi:hypothetical protein